MNGSAEKALCALLITLGLSCSSRCSAPQAAPLIATCELIYFHAGLLLGSFPRIVTAPGICRGNSLEMQASSTEEDRCSRVLFTQNWMFEGS